SSSVVISPSTVMPAPMIVLAMESSRRDLVRRSATLAACAARQLGRQLEVCVEGARKLGSLLQDDRRAAEIAAHPRRRAHANHAARADVTFELALDGDRVGVDVGGGAAALGDAELAAQRDVALDGAF